MVAVTGCVAQQEGESLLKRSAMVDVVVGTRRVRMLPLLVEQAARTASSRRSTSARTTTSPSRSA